MYEPPVAASITIFTYDEKRKSIALGTAWTSSSILAVDVTETMKKDSKVSSTDADHEFAMALQKKINSGESC